MLSISNFSNSNLDITEHHFAIKRSAFKKKTSPKKRLQLDPVVKTMTFPPHFFKIKSKGAFQIYKLLVEAVRSQNKDQTGLVASNHS